MNKIKTQSLGCSLSRLAMVSILMALILALALPPAALAADPAPMAASSPGKILENLHYKIDVWIWRDAVDAQVVFREAGPGRYQAEVDGRSQGLLALVTGGWRGRLSTDMEYAEGGLRPLVYKEISYKKGKKRVMEYRFNYAAKKVELWKQEGDGPLAKHWEADLTGPMYDPLTFFYNRRITGQSLAEKGGENLKFQGIPYPKPDPITLRVGDKTGEGRKIMLELGNRIHKDERSVVYAYLDSDGVPTKAQTQVGTFGNVDITLLPGGKRLNKAEVSKGDCQARAGGN